MYGSIDQFGHAGTTAFLCYYQICKIHTLAQRLVQAQKDYEEQCHWILVHGTSEVVHACFTFCSLGDVEGMS